MRGTRHPFLNGVILHRLSNGETRSAVLFAGMLILSAGGVWHIDKSREYYYGAD
ncbi:MAG: NnrU family protein [Alphaproteobacteria bacterium]